MRIRDVILDWSGTLVDDLPPVLKTMNHVLAQYGLAPLGREEFRREFCLPLRTYYQRKIPHVPVAELERAFLARYPEHQHEIRLLPHAAEFLRFCVRAELGVYVASTADADTYRQQMQRFGLAGHVRRSYLGIEDKTEKIHEILAENRLDRHQTLFVGDMEHDIAAGQAGGVHTCAVLTGYTHRDQLLARGPELVCEHLGELQALLAGSADDRSAAGAGRAGAHHLSKSHG